jgi:XTP/dITP diphosphohydrolase
MSTLVFATGNKHKIKEVKSILPTGIRLISLSDLAYADTLPETDNTLEGNALQKARLVCQLFGYNCFADDTGLEVEALNGEPGVYSARYAGEECDSFANVQKLLRSMAGLSNRNARFRTVIALMFDGGEYLFEGIVNGQITQSVHGETGFGYDPVFVPENHTQTFAEMGDRIKNTISHRAIAVKQLADFLAKTK